MRTHSRLRWPEFIRFSHRVAAAIAFWLAGAASAAPPATLGFQGYLTNASSAPVNGNVSVTFRLYSAASGGTHLWTETQPTVAVANGLYSVVLGSVAPIALAFDVPYYLGVSVGADAEMTPRMPLTSSGYAFRAAMADTATTALTAPGAAPWVEVSGSSQLAASNTGYVVTGATLATITLPATPAVGDIVRASSASSGGFEIAANAGQGIVGGGVVPNTWTARAIAANWRSVASSADGTKLAAVVAGGQIYTSTDSGVTWTARDIARDWRSIASSADGTKLVAAVFSGNLYRSADSGVTWTPPMIDAIQAWQSVAITPDGTLRFAGGQAGLYRSTDGGASWSLRDTAFPRNWEAIATSADGSKIAAVFQNGDLWTSVNGGSTFTSRSTARPWTAIASSTDGVKLAATVTNTVGTGLIYTSADSGVTLTARESLRLWSSIASSADGTKLVAAAKNSQLWASTDSGVSWIPRDVSRLWSAVASSSDGSKLLAAVENGQLYTGTVTSIKASAFSTAELVYSGNGQWIVVSRQGTFN